MRMFFLAHIVRTFRNTVMENLSGILQKNAGFFQPVVPFDPVSGRLLHLDFSMSGPEPAAEIVSDLSAFTRYIQQRLDMAGARYGIGGYAELRSVYAMSRVFDAETEDGEPRRLHLGVDIWGKPYTAVMAPLPGIIHSFGYNDRPGDYGATILLSHQLEDHHFFTLYGHLSLNSIKNIQEGDRVEGGSVFAEFGIPSENGQWPPHLHFQLIGEIGDCRGDYPGVCAFSEKEKFLANSPDPDLVLQLNRYLGK